MVTMNVPSKLTAGDTWTWLEALADYPAPAWTLSVHLKSASGNISVSATDESGDHRVTFTAANTANVPAGRYTWSAMVSDGTQRFTVASGQVDVLPDPAAAGNLDLRTPTRRVVDALEAALEAHATGGAWMTASYTIYNRSETYRTPEEAITALERLRRIAEREEALRAGAEQFTPGQTIYGVFTR